MDYQFYPTGMHTAYKMAKKFKTKIKHLCDPSAGQGHLLNYFKSRFAGYIPPESAGNVANLEAKYSCTTDHAISIDVGLKFEREYEVSAIEIDFKHHPNIREVGAKIIGHDFMDVESLATVSHVVMNPPFNQGAEHVLHAFDILYSGELVAIINAQTIKNPCNANRARLLKIINDHGTVEFMQDEFVDNVERKTNVEIALIYLEKIPSSLTNLDRIFVGQKKGDNGYSELELETSFELDIPKSYIENTVERFNIAVDAARKSAEANAVAHKASWGLGISLQEMQAKGVDSSFRPELGDIGEIARNDFLVSYNELKGKAWASIIRSTEVTKHLSNQARKKLESKASEISELEFTVSNIHGFLRGLVESMGEVYSEMICDMFDNIMGRSNENVVFHKAYKSNLKHRTVGMRIKKRRFILPNFDFSFRTLRYSDKCFLSDLDKICYHLDGKTLDKSSNSLTKALDGEYVESGTKISTDYFNIRVYRGTGTIHFYPNDTDIIDRINRYVGRIRQWIPADMDAMNDDFKKQYDEAERFSDAYVSKWKSKAGNKYRCPVHTVKSGVQADDNGIINMEQSINEYLSEKGLEPGLAICQKKGQQLLLAA